MVRTSEWISEAWRVLTGNIWPHVLLALIVSVGSTVTLGILLGPLACGWFHIVLRQLREPDYQPQIGDVGKGFEVFVQALLAWLVMLVGGGIVVGVLVFVGAFLPIIGQLLPIAAGLAIGLVFLFVFPLIMDRRLGFWEAITQSYQKVGESFWPFVGFVALLTVINMAGSAVCGIGSLITQPLVMIATALAYRDHFGAEAEPVVAPPPVEPPPPTEEPPA